MIGLFIKSFLSVVVMLALVGMFFMPMELAIADSHHSKSNKCRTVCKHRNKHGVCLIRKKDCSGSKKKAEKVKFLAGVKPDKPSEPKKSENKMECKKKHDKPRVSRHKKGIHMDEDCCLDPDEFPDPRCHYDPKKYGKYL